MIQKAPLLLALVAGLAFLPIAAGAQDPVEANPGKYRVLFENESVRLLEYWDEPGDQSQPHDHPDHLVYSLSSWQREFVLEDGTVVTGESKAGDVMWIDANRHSGRNSGEVPTHALIFEVKRSSETSSAEKESESSP